MQLVFKELNISEYKDFIKNNEILNNFINKKLENLSYKNVDQDTYKYLLNSIYSFDIFMTPNLNMYINIKENEENIYIQINSLDLHFFEDIYTIKKEIREIKKEFYSFDYFYEKIKNGTILTDYGFLNLKMNGYTIEYNINNNQTTLEPKTVDFFVVNKSLKIKANILTIKFKIKDLIDMNLFEEDFLKISSDINKNIYENHIEKYII